MFESVRCATESSYSIGEWHCNSIHSPGTHVPTAWRCDMHGISVALKSRDLIISYGRSEFNASPRIQERFGGNSGRTEMNKSSTSKKATLCFYSIWISDGWSCNLSSWTYNWLPYDTLCCFTNTKGEGDPYTIICRDECHLLHVLHQRQKAAAI